MALTQTFLPWLRQGFGTRIPEPDTLGKTDGLQTGRVNLDFKLHLSGFRADGSEVTGNAVDQQVSVAGPGDVLGIERSVVVRAVPRAGTPNYEPNYLAYIEFYEEDFPWRYTPANPDPAHPDRLRPWLALLVLETAEFRLEREGAREWIVLQQETADDVFHDHRETWAWAHVQLTRPRPVGATADALSADVDDFLKKNPDLGVSRLLCPRRLRPSASYTAFLIPAFESGRLAGLGEDPGTVPTQMASWKKGEPLHSETRPLEYPVYYSWSFQTGLGGDFETLARRLHPVRLGDPLEPGGPKPVPTLPMDVHEPGFGLSLPEGQGIQGFEPALLPDGFERKDFPAGNEQINYQNQLRKLLNLSTVQDFNSSSTVISGVGNASDDPIVLPPIYGAAHTGFGQLGAPATLPWVDQLNLDPRYRAVAGFGVRAVQERQEELMESAWQQIEAVEAANRRIHEAKATELMATRIWQKHFQTAPENMLLQLVAPINGLVMESTGKQTVFDKVQNSQLGQAALSPTLRRVARPFRREQSGWFGGKTFEISVQQFDALPFQRGAFASFAAGWTIQERNRWLEEYDRNSAHWNRKRNAFLEILEAAELEALNVSFLQTKVNQRSDLSQTEEAEVRNWMAQLTAFKFTKIFFRPDPFKAGTWIQVRTASLEPDWYTLIFGPAAGNTIKLKTLTLSKSNPDPDPGDTAQAFDPSRNEFIQLRDAVSSFYQFGTTTVIAHRIPTDNYSALLTAALDPAKVYKAKVAAAVQIFTGNDQPETPLPELTPIQAYPQFTEPTYEYLAAFSKDYLVPFLDRLPDNGVALLETNPPVVEAFLAGLNTEMGRELLWRGYPTDQRGSYFRQFWDDMDNFPELHTWTKKLGENHPPALKSNLVLVVRGELLRKYPRTLVYARRAKPALDSHGFRKLSTEVRQPVFSAFLEPDIALIGFNLTDVEARGLRGANQPSKAGWYFVFQERPGQLAFGMDETEIGQPFPPPPPATWNDLRWEHFAEAPGADVPVHLGFKKMITPTTPPPNGAIWGKNAADMAAILLQRPILVARHAAELI